MSELRYALRQLVRHPGLPLAVILMVALGVGATTAIYSLYHEILVRPLPVPAADRLVNVVETGQQAGTIWCPNLGCERTYALSYPMFRELEARQDVFTGIAGHHGPFEANVAFGGRAASRGTGMLVTGGYFRTLNVEATLGRLIAPEDEPRIDESPVAVLSHDYWSTRLGGDESVVGRTLAVNGLALSIIGVAPPGFSGTVIGGRPDFFVPATLREAMQPGAMRYQRYEDPFAYWIYAFGRLRPGISIGQAAARLTALHAGVVRDLEAGVSISEMPAEPRAISLEPGARGQSSIPETATPPLRLLLGVTVLLLLVVCLNIASLLLARSLGRRSELAVRASLGADRMRIVRQLLTEAAAPAVIGVLLALPVAAAVLRVATTILPAELAPGLDVHLDPRVTVLAAGLSLATVLLVALVPAARAARTEAALALMSRAVPRGGSPDLHGAFAASQIAISMVLLALATLFAQSLANVARVDLGFDSASLVAFGVAPPLTEYDRDRVIAFGASIQDEIAAWPGVTSVSLSSWPLLRGGTLGFAISVEGFENASGEIPGASTNAIAPGFFETLSIPLLAGRDFVTADASGPPVAIVNESFVSRFALGDDALGRRLGIFTSGEHDIEIVGVVGDAKYGNVKDADSAQFFTPLRQQDSVTALQFYVRTRADVDSLLRAIPGIVAGIDPNVPVDDLGTMQRQIQDNVFVDRLVTMLAAGFATLATLLAAIGIYGVLSYGVVQRTRELGLRLAIGAERHDLLAMVLRRVGVLAAVGGLFGLAGALAAGVVARSLLFGLSPFEPMAYLVAGTILAVVVIGAGCVPALRASRVSPIDALRHE